MNLRGRSMSVERLRYYGAAYAVLLAMLAVVLCIGILRPSFLQIDNLIKVLRASATTGIMAVGLTIVVGAGAFDLSVAGVSTLATVLVVFLILGGWPAFPAILTGIAVGVVTGTFAGFLVAKRNFNPFAATLALWLAANGPQYIMLKGGSDLYLTASHAPLLQTLGRGSVLGIPWLVVILLAIGAATHFIYSRTKLGIWMSSLGDNREAVVAAGVNTQRVLWLSYVICGLLAAVAGVLMAARLHSAQARVGEGYLNDVIAAVFLGAAISPNRRPHVIGAIIGSFFITLVSNGIYMLNAPQWGEQILRAMMLFAAVMSSGMFQSILWNSRRHGKEGSRESD